MADSDVPDSTDWLSTPLRALAAVEASLRCQVCKDFYRTPMLTSCCHTFCSLCIRRALSNDGKCPLCRAGEQELKLRSNWSMEETVEAFVKARPDVLAEARAAANRRASSPKRKANDTDILNGEDGAPTSKRVRTSARLSKNRADVQPTRPVVEHEEPEEEEVVEVPDDTEDETYNPVPETQGHGLVACPVCNNKMKEWQVFKHLESCTGPPSPTTNGQSSTSTSLSLASHRKPAATAADRLPPINYSMLKDNALRKKLSELGISPSGPRPLLEKRHKEWITLWNANCDAARPKKRNQLLHDLDVWERTQGGRAPTTGRTVQNAALIKDKDFDGRAWANTHDDSFRELIENARKSRAKTGGDKAEAETKTVNEDPSTSEGNDQAEQSTDAVIPSSQEADMPMDVGEDGTSGAATALGDERPEALTEIRHDSNATVPVEGELSHLRSKDNDWESTSRAPVQ